MKIRVLLLALFLTLTSAYADTAQTPAQPDNTQVLVTPQNIPFESCTKMFGGTGANAVNKEKLFYLTLGAISANRFTVEEIQTEYGYIIFKAAKQKYLATVAEIDNNNSVLRITPCNNVYFFQPGILVNIYKYIELNKGMVIK